MSCDVIIILSSSEDEAVAGVEAMDVKTGKTRKKKRTGSGRKKVKKVKAVEDNDDDCCILSFDPFLDEVIDSRRRFSLSSPKSPDDLVVVAERGHVACRDYPHSRHLCVKYPFNKTSHESCCLKCFCYVCDVAAPCESWKEKDGGHCHAYESHSWKSRRRTRRSFARNAQ